MPFVVRLKEVGATTYVSRARALRPEEIDAFVTGTIRDLRGGHPSADRPFTLYHGCDADERQLVEVCLPTASGHERLQAGRVAYTVARGVQCDYPAITKAYDSVARFLEEQGLTPAGPPRETYLSEPDADEPVMEVAFPVD